MGKRPKTVWRAEIITLEGKAEKETECLGKQLGDRNFPRAVLSATVQTCQDCRRENINWVWQHEKASDLVTFPLESWG